jgi:predicted ATPase
MKLEELLALQDGSRRVAVTGLGGVGKTQVALEAAYYLRFHDEEYLVFWIPCTSPVMVQQLFLNIAQRLGLLDVKPANVKE